MAWSAKSVKQRLETLGLEAHVNERYGEIQVRRKDTKHTIGGYSSWQACARALLEKTFQ